jgi:hypothetical protein
LISCSELRKTVADETAAIEAVQVMLMSAQVEFKDLERTAVAVYQELEGEGGLSGSSVANRLRSLGGRMAEHLRSTQELEGEGGLYGSSMANRLRSLGGRMAEHLRSTFHLGVLRTLAVASTHYDLNLEQVATGYVVAPGVEGDAPVAAMEQDDAAVEGFASVLSMKLEDDLLPDVEDDAAEGPHGGEGNL